MLDRADSQGIHSLPTALPVAFPAWARPKNPPESEAEAAFLTGAALSRLDAIVRENPPWAGVFRQRLALAAAAASVARAGRAEDEAALRDALHLTRPGADPGPAGRRLIAWRELVGRSAGQWRSSIAGAAAVLGVPNGEALQQAIDAAEAGAVGGRPAPFAAARKDERHCPTERAENSRQASKCFPAGPASAPGRVRWNASRNAASSSGRPARATLAAAALSARRRRKTPAQGGFSRTTASSWLSAAPARKAASASLSGGLSARAQAGNAAGAAAEGPEIPSESARASMPEGYPMAALSPSSGERNRRACRIRIMSDKVALSTSYNIQY